MARIAGPKLPSIFWHQRGYFACKFKGKMISLGKDREGAQRRLLQLALEGPGADQPDGKPLLMAELATRYMEHAVEYYRNDPKEVANCKRLLAMILDVYADVPAAEFGPKKLQAIRNLGVQAHGWCRKFANAQAVRARRVFRWAVEQEIVSPSVLEGLKALSPLREGKGIAHDNPPRGPVSEKDFEATMAELGEMPRAICRVMWATGMRPSEVCRMRVGDLDLLENPWRYRLVAHKTRAHVGGRVVFLGPESQAAIRPHLRPNPDGLVFRTPEGSGYTPHAVTRAVERAAKRAGVPRWTVYAIRHAAADRIQRALGAETAKIMLGHTTMKMTENYLTPDMVKAREAAAKIG